jgi:hypothetical protein
MIETQTDDGFQSSFIRELMDCLDALPNPLKITDETAASMQSHYEEHLAEYYPLSIFKVEIERDKRKRSFSFKFVKRESKKQTPKRMRS